MSLDEARTWVRDNRRDGVICPCCGQMAKEYRRRINSAQAAAVLTEFRRQVNDGGTGQDWFYLPAVDPSREASKLVYWGLLEHDDTRREDGGQSGWWRITDAGVRWLRNRSVVPAYAFIYDSVFQGFDNNGHASVVDALGRRFNYFDLMRGH